MGKSGYLPDISSTFAFWRANAIICYKEDNLHGAEAALYNINACLTEEYILELNTAQYEKSIHEAITYECGFCKAFTPINQINIFDWLPPGLLSVMTSYERIKSWRCLKCEEVNPMIGTTIIHEKLASPFFQKFMYEPPKREIGILYRYNFKPKFRKWFYKFLELLQHQLALYRIEYKNQTGEDMSDSGWQDKGDQVIAHNN